MDTPDDVPLNISMQLRDFPAPRQVCLSAMMEELRRAMRNVCACLPNRLGRRWVLGSNVDQRWSTHAELGFQGQQKDNSIWWFPESQGYPQSSSILDWDFPWHKPSIFDTPMLGNIHLLLRRFPSDSARHRNRTGPPRLRLLPCRVRCLGASQRKRWWTLWIHHG